MPRCMGSPMAMSNDAEDTDKDALSVGRKHGTAGFEKTFVSREGGGAPIRCPYLLRNSLNREGGAFFKE